jgi:hypothetical protein
MMLASAQNRFEAPDDSKWSENAAGLRVKYRREVHQGIRGHLFDALATG